MDLLQIREKEIFEALNAIKKFDFVIIGGYAVNAYTLPRFSVDCDIIVKSLDLAKELEKIGYEKKDLSKVKLAYTGKFFRYEKKLPNDFKVSFDIFSKEVMDRETSGLFNEEWIFGNSSIRELRGKTISQKLKLRIISLDALVVMKFVSCRNTDIRDIFMLAPQITDAEWIKKEISERVSFKDYFNKIKDKITEKKFKDSLQGVFGFIDNAVFEKHKKAVLSLD